MSMIIANECTYDSCKSRIPENFEKSRKWEVQLRETSVISHTNLILLREFLKVANFRQAISEVLGTNKNPRLSISRNV